MGNLLIMDKTYTQEQLDAALEQMRVSTLEEAAKVCDSVNNYDNPMTATDCAAAIRGLK